MQIFFYFFCFLQQLWNILFLWLIKLFDTQQRTFLINSEFFVGLFCWSFFYKKKRFFSCIDSFWKSFWRNSTFFIDFFLFSQILFFVCTFWIMDVTFYFISFFQRWKISIVGPFLFNHWISMSSTFSICYFFTDLFIRLFILIFFNGFSFFRACLIQVFELCQLFSVE